MKSFKALLLLFGAAVAYLPSPSVLTPPPIITAGVETPIEFNFSASSCSSSFDSERGCDWPFFRPFLVADPTFDNSDQSNVFVQEYMCFLSPCVSTNLTSFDAVIPPTAVPNGGPYTLAYGLFAWLENGTIDSYYPIWSGFESTRFNITGANTSWTPYDLTGRYDSDNGQRSWYYNVSCEALECARKCANEIVAPKVPYVGGEIPEVDACVEACPEYGWDPRQCVTENAADFVPSATSAATSPTTSSASSSQAAGSAPFRPSPSSAGGASGVSLVLLLSSFAVATI